MLNQINLFLSRRIRSTPFENRSFEAGASSYTIYNKMTLPVSFGTLREDYNHLVEHVQLWDVSAERQVEIRGPDAHKVVELITPRDLSNIKVGQGMYAPLCDEHGNMINDPIILCLAEDRFWLSIADSDVVLWVKGIVYGRGYDVEVFEPDVSPLAIQGPKANDMMASILGDEIRSLKFFWFIETTIEGIDVVVQRSGWSGQGGFEVYLQDSSDGEKLWDIIWQAGEPFNIRAGCPNLIDRVESDLISYGTDMTLDNNPFECGLDRFFSLGKEAEYMSREALDKIMDEGVRRRKVNLMIEGDSFPCRTALNIIADGRDVGILNTTCFSPKNESLVGFSIIETDYAVKDTHVKIELDDGTYRNAIVYGRTWKNP